MENSRKNKMRWICLLGLTIMIASLVVLFFFLTRGNTTVSNSGANIEKSVTLVCESTDYNYPFFVYNDANKKDVTIKSIYDDEELASLSLSVRLYYDSDSEIDRSEAANHAALAKSLAEDNLDITAYRVNFSKLKDSMQMTIVADTKEITGITSKYFLLEKTGGVFNREKMADNYKSLGFNCVVSN